MAPAQLQHARFRLYWLAIVLSHVTSALYLLLFAGFHATISTQQYFCRQFSVQTNLVFVAIVYVALSAVHLRRVATIFQSSFKARALRFESSNSNLTSASPTTTQQEPSLHAKTPPTFQRWILPWMQLWEKYLARSGVFGIFGEHGDVRIWGVEYLNLGAHLFQGSCWSLLTRPAANAVIASLLACECLYPALYHRVTSGKALSKANRARLVLLDIAIDTLVCAVIPTWLVAPFVVQYLVDPHVVNSNYSETWYAEGVLSFKQSLATTSLDLITKLSPFCLNYVSLVEISSGRSLLLLLQDANHGVRVASIASLRFDSRVVGRQIVPEAAPKDESSSAGRLLPTRWQRSKTIAFRCLRVVFAVTGVLFALLALSSAGLLGSRPVHQCPAGCLYETAPWFSRGDCCCIVQEINCVKLNISGSDGIGAELDAYARGANLAVLILNECRGLVIPKAIRSFPNLLGLIVYSSDLADWSEDAALTSDAFALITYVLIVNSTLSEIPAGLLTNLASTVQDIEIIASASRVVLPDNLHELWPSVGTFYLERCHLAAFPEPLLNMSSLKQLSLAGNSLDQLPETLFASPLFESLQYLVLSANRELTSLPPHINAAATLHELYVDATNVTTLELSDVSASSDLAISAARTPLCTNSGAPGNSRVVCAGLYGGMYTLGVYPFLSEQRATRSAKFLPVDDLV